MCMALRKQRAFRLGEDDRESSLNASGAPPMVTRTREGRRWKTQARWGQIRVPVRTKPAFRRWGLNGVGYSVSRPDFSGLARSVHGLHAAP